MREQKGLFETWHDAVMLVSQNGMDWDAVNLRYIVTDVTFGDGRDVAVGPHGVVLLSSDGQTWSLTTPGTREDLWAVAFGGDRYVALGFSRVNTSPDGLTWSMEYGGLPVKAGQEVDAPIQLVYGDGVWVAYGVNLVDGLLTSADLQNWQSRKDQFGNIPPICVAYGNGRFVGISSGGFVFVSQDGMKWTWQENQWLNARTITYGGGQFLAAGQGAVYLSTDGTTWTTVPCEPLDPSFATYLDGEFVVVGGNYQGLVVHSSPDGRQWQKSGPDPGFGEGVAPVALAAGNGRLVLAGDKGTILVAKNRCAITPEGNGTPVATFKVGCTSYTTGGKTNNMDTVVFTENDRSYVPVRFLAYALGIRDDAIAWDDATSTVTLKKGTRTVALTVGSTMITIDGVQQDMQVAPMMVPPGRLVLPARLVAEAFGYQVGWDQATQSILLFAPNSIK